MNQYNYKMLIAYDGTQYGGWQVQPNATSIQELIAGAIKTILQHPVTLIGSGRTDAGVHALEQVAHFKCDKDLDLFRFHGSLNGILPRDIRILDVKQAPLDFHSQRSATSKIYCYHLCLDRVQDPFNRLYSVHVRESLDIDLLKKAATHFVGTLNFTSFSNESDEGCAARDPVRTIFRLDIVPEKGGLRIEIEADGFLYKMVRNIVGTLLEVAKSKRDITDIPRIFAACDRRQAGQAAPAHGLFLAKVKYDDAEF